MPSKPMLIYDGYCNLCSWLVRFTQRFDKKERIALQPSQNFEGKFDVSIPNQVFTNSVVFISPQGKVYVKSRAALRVLKTLGGVWSVSWVLFLLIPNPIRDFLYNFISKNRYKWFGKRQTCYYPVSKTPKK
jgi:predicted DCC family thiol-disulfide oxidoreductase YuxK